ncbi:MAG TPA: type 1 glutamine amidotransferase [Methylophilaceae bacterium]|nr:type 1 glutamine amidotransferase [Methylophilaceae bacterium]
MKPVVIFRHALTEGPGFLATFLDEKHIPWQLIKIDQGELLPVSIKQYSGVVLMGGPMSVNDDLPWIPHVLNLIQEAVREDIPLLGHCLGGQLISKALGASVTQNRIKEIGWGRLSVEDPGEAQRWLGDIQEFDGFHWHGETFSLPQGATLFLSSTHCQNQAYSIGKHLAFQCHIEMTAEMVKKWCEVGTDELAEAADSPGVQPAFEIQQDLDARVTRLNSHAKKTYEQWILGLKHKDAR